MMEVVPYFMYKDASKQLTKNFKVSEFKSRNYPVLFIEPQLVDYLQQIRDKVKSPINVNSGFRSNEHNTSVGGSTNSAHLIGCAADISCPSVGAETLAKIAYNLFSNKIAIGLHTKENYIHIDTIYKGNFYRETLSNKVTKF